MTDLNINTLEKYIFADNKEEFLKTITPYTEHYYLFEIMIEFQKSKVDHKKIDQLVKAFLDRNNNFKHEHKELVKFKLLLAKFEQEKSNSDSVASIIDEINKDYLNLSFNHTSPFGATVTSELRQDHEKVLESELQPHIKDEQSLEKLLKDIYEYKTSYYLSRIGDEYKSLIDISKFSLPSDKDIIIAILQKQTFMHDSPNIIGLACDLKKHYPNENHVETYIWPQLTFPQKESLLQNELFVNNEVLTDNYVTSKFGIAKSEISKKPMEEKVARYEELRAFAKTLPKKFKDYIRLAIHKILRYQVKLGKVDEDLFLEYLNDPCSPFLIEFSEDFKTKIRKQRGNVNSNYRSINYSERKDSKLIEEILSIIFQTASDYKRYLNFLSEENLKKIFYGTKAMSNGETSGIKSAFGERELENIFNKKLIEIKKSNKKRFNDNDEVQLQVDIKNVNKLKVQIFEVNTLNYLLENGVQNYEKLELSGLIPTEEYLYNYTHDQILKHTETFNFQSIQDKKYGVFVVDFIGDELNSRAVIYKSSLNLISDRTTGRKCYILSENGSVCVGENTGLYIQKKFFAASEATGEINIPLNIKSINENVIVTHVGFADMCMLQTSDVQFSLSTNLIYNSEQFVAGNNVEFIVQAKLFINKEQVSLALLSSPSIDVSFTNDKDVVNKIDFKDLNLNDQRDLTFTTIFPPKIQLVEIFLSAELKYGGNTQTLSDNQSILLQQNVSNNIDHIYFQKSGNDDILVYVVGKNGEGRPGLVVDLNIKCQYSTFETMSTLITNKDGVCNLGPFESLLYVTAKCGEVCQTYFELPPISKTFEQKITICTKQDVEIKLAKDNKTIKLLSYKGSGVKAEDLTTSHTKVENSTLTVENLSVGMYALHIDNKVILIEVVEGEYLNFNERMIKTGTKFMEVPVSNERKLSQVSQTRDETVIEVISNSKNSRAHLLTFNFVPGLISELLEESKNFKNTSANCREREIQIKQRNNYYHSHRKLNDEVIYANDRKSKMNFMGNTLEKPGILLKRNRIGETSETEQVVNKGDNFENAKLQQAYVQSANVCADKFLRCPPSEQDGSSSYIPKNGIFLYDYLNTPGKLTANLKLKDGKLRIPSDAYRKFAYAIVCLTDETGTTLIPIHSDNHPVDLRDTSLKVSKKINNIYNYDRQTKKTLKGGHLVIENIQNTNTYIVKSMKDLFKVLKIIQGNNNKELSDWSFLTEWSTLAPMEKLKKYDKYVSHEFHLFLKFKDREFFDDVVVPFLQNKYEKTLVDFFLLDDIMGVKERLDISSFAELNKLEKVLLASMAAKCDRELADAFCRFLLAKSALARPTEQTRELIFETILNDKMTSSVSPLELFGGDGLRIQDRGESSLGDMNQCGISCVQAPMQARMLRTSAKSGSMFGMNSIKLKAPLKKETRFTDKRMEENEYQLDDNVLPTGDANLFTPSNGTIEYNERKYFYGNFSFEIQEFWSDLSIHLCSVQSNAGFLSENFIFGAQTMSELLCVLAFMDFSFDSPKVITSNEDGRLKIESEENMLILTNEIVEKEADKIEMDILCAQRMFDPNDRFVFDEQDSKLKIERNIDEFIIGKVYGSRVVVTNSSASDLNLSLIYEIPQGSISLGSLDTLKIENLYISSFQSKIVEFYFYFPQVGTFNLYPATVVKGQKIVAIARSLGPITVDKTKKIKKLETMADIVAMGNTEDIIQFMRQKNILNPQIISFHQIYWLLKNKQFFQQAIAVCREKGVYDSTLWAYSFFHKDLTGVKEYLKDNRNGVQFKFLSFAESEIFTLDRFELREYYPLINPRAHVIGKEKTNIINNKFKETYDQFLKHLFQKPTLTVKDKVLLMNYMIAQDRIEEASIYSANISAPEITDLKIKIQYDYQRAYLDFITGYPKFDTVKRICEEYLTYPILSWRNLFVEMVNQLAEFEEVELHAALNVKKEGEAKNKDKGKKGASFTAELIDGKIKLMSQNLNKVDIRYFKLEPETLFSLNPFDYDSGKSFKFIQPFFKDTLLFKFPEELSISYYEINPKLQRESFFIEASSQSPELSQSLWINYAPFALKLQHLQEFGIVKVFDLATHKPVPRVYVKCFSKDKSGKIKFYKDGYTDLRGSFDYVSLNSDKLDNLAKFAVLIFSDEFGSKIVLTDPPVKIGRVEGEVKALVSENWRQIQSKQCMNAKEKYTKLI